jgi:hypothetical protein
MIITKERASFLIAGCYDRTHPSSLRDDNQSVERGGTFASGMHH